MHSTIIAVATVAEMAQARDVLVAAKKQFTQAQRILCVLDAQEQDVLAQELDIQIVRAQSLFETAFYDEAFFFPLEEFRLRCGLILSKLCVQKGGDALLIHPQAKFSLGRFLAPDVNEIAGVAACVQPSEPSVVFTLEKNKVLASHFLAFGAGNATIRFLTWCCKKFTWLFNEGMPAQGTVLLQRGISAIQRDFVRNFTLYAPWFGCTLSPFSPRVLQCTMQETALLPYRFAQFENGMPLFDLLRDCYGVSYRLREKCAGNPFAHPAFFAEESALTGDTHAVPVPYVLWAFYSQRADLQKQMPAPFGADREALVQWFLDYGAKEADLRACDTALLKEKLAAYQKNNTEQDVLQRSLPYRVKHKTLRMMGQKKQQNTPQYPAGINLCGFIQGDFGLGEATRLLAETLQAGNVPFTIVDYHGATEHTYQNHTWDAKISNQFLYNTNLIMINADGFAAFAADVAPEAMQNRYNIGFWYWELPEFPPAWQESLQFVDEIWTASDFTTDSVRRITQKPVRTIPCCITQTAEEGLIRADFGLPDDVFLFLMMYDVRSFSARKNPQGAVDAFLKAFENNAAVHLLLKVNAPADWDGDDALLARLAPHENIHILVETSTKERLNALICLCDAFVSLHRSEGFGLGPAEAMYWGKPAVLTDWSGNKVYMKEDNCCPVACKIVEIDKDYGPYKKGYHWAEPDLDDAAEKMRHLVEDKEYYHKIANNGKNTIRMDFSPSAIGKQVLDRLTELKRMDAEGEQ
ncbi:MAG: glycosyltransferase [Ruthenibacterium sp.]